MAQGQISLKRIGVNKTNGRIFVIIAAAAFLVVFFLMGSYMLFKQLTYQNKVMGVKRDAVKQLEANVKASGTLVSSYESFIASPQNLIGGVPEGNGPRDGNNAKIVLDALPSKYDFPALAASLEKVLTDQHVSIKSITGTDDEIVQAGQQGGGASQPVEIPFEISVTGDYSSIQGVITALDRSIRPFQILSTKVAGDQDSLSLTVTGKTFYQPEKSLTITKKVVK